MGKVTVDGVPLAEVIDADKNSEIQQHMRERQRVLARQCGVRRLSSTAAVRAGCRGHPGRTWDVLLWQRMLPLLNAGCSTKEVAAKCATTSRMVRRYRKHFAPKG